MHSYLVYLTLNIIFSVVFEIKPHSETKELEVKTQKR
jgi:hypothetical protein